MLTSAMEKLHIPSKLTTLCLVRRHSKQAAFIALHSTVLLTGSLEPEWLYTEEVATMWSLRLICNWHQGVRR